MLRLVHQHWHALSPLLDKALEMDPGGRAGLIAEVERHEPDVAHLLARLLEEHERLADSNFLESSLAVDDTPSPSLSGCTIGAYTLDTRIGMGGMGTVWRAHRSDGRFDGYVAVKLLNLALVDRGGDERFNREGTLLARLAHPHIARMLDAGVTPAGQPYLILEYVDGIRIDQFADEQRLNPLRRLQLFLQVADAVAHAHANLITHRDLKPTNILVNRDGQVKLLDFGVGKLLETTGSTSSPITLPGTAALTPEYAAPEQLRGEPVTTATDVYALGVLLYVLLTGRHPTGATCRTPAEHIAALLTGDPVLASDAVVAPTRTEAAQRATLRGSTPERLRRFYRRDLDNLLTKALEKSPDRRYPSVTALSDDIRRFIDHEPLSVHGRRWRYRAAKFVRRHRWPVAAAAIAFAMLTTGFLIVNQQRQIADRRFSQLRQLSQQVFELDNRIRNLAGATDARRALVAASLEYLEALSRDASGDLDLLQDVSEGYLRVARIQGVPTGLTLGKLADAEASLKRADDLVHTILASRPHDRRALVRAALVAHDRMIVADSERRDADALIHARRAVARMDALLNEGAPTESERESAFSVYGNVAAAYVNMHRADDAIRYATRVREIAARYGSAPSSVSYALTVLANARRSQGDLDGALEAIREAREISDRASYPNETKRMFDRYPLLLREAFILGEDRGISLNRGEEAMVLLREAMAMHEAGARRDASDFTSRTRVATVGRELGDILRWRAPQDAVAVYDVALARLGEIPDSINARRDRALVLANSSYALRRLNRIEDARRRVDDALAILQKANAYPSDRIAIGGELCSVLQARADQSAAEGRLSEATAQYEELVGKVMAAGPDLEHDLRAAYSLALLYRDFARLRRSAGEPVAAQILEAKARAIWIEWTRTHPDNAFVRRQLDAKDDAADNLGR